MSSKIGTQSLIAYIITPCVMAASGLKVLMKHQGFDTETILLDDTDLEDNLTKNGGMVNSPGLCIIYIPDESFYFLLTLINIAKRIKNPHPETNFIFISSVSCAWFHQNLQQMTGGGKFSFNTQIISSKLSIRRLEQYFQRIKLNIPFTFRNRFIVEKIRTGSEGLTLRETEVLLDLFRCDNSKFVKRNRNVASKTLCNQRKSGLRKMVENSAELAKKLPGASKRWRSEIADNEISPYEKDFIAAIEMQEVYQVYQPIINADREIYGFEILTRWYQKECIVYPDEFIPNLKSETVLLLLTAMSIKNAVDGINRYHGKYFFSINIHPALAGCSGLVRMCSEACRQIKDIQWKHRLVLEYSEQSDFYKSHGTIDVLNSIGALGVTLFLDDCFSEGSVFFPVRQYSFNGYKLDKSIVDNSLASKEDMALIASLANYCSLTARHCIAEGVEDLPTFEKLKGLGIEHFQGQFFHRPVSLTELPSLVIKAQSS